MEHNFLFCFISQTSLASAEKNEKISINLERAREENCDTVTEISCSYHLISCLSHLKGWVKSGSWECDEPLADCRTPILFVPFAFNSTSDKAKLFPFIFNWHIKIAVLNLTLCFHRKVIGRQTKMTWKLLYVSNLSIFRQDFYWIFA